VPARLRKAFRWLEKAITYLDERKPPIDHRFDLGHGLVCESPRFGHGSVGQHTFVCVEPAATSDAAMIRRTGTPPSISGRVGIRS
jgi:hypothetical protein